MLGPPALSISAMISRPAFLTLGENKSCDFASVLCHSGLTERYMNCNLRKNSVRTSNWEGRVLSYEQQLYAAADAFASLKLYQVITSAIFINRMSWGKKKEI